MLSNWFFDPRMSWRMPAASSAPSDTYGTVWMFNFWAQR
jgi:hypothetical protein